MRTGSAPPLRSSASLSANLRPPKVASGPVRACGDLPKWHMNQRCRGRVGLEGQPQNPLMARPIYHKSLLYNDLYRQYAAQSRRFEASRPRYEASNPQFGASRPEFEASRPRFRASKRRFGAAKPRFRASKPRFEASKPRFEASKPRSEASKRRFEASRRRFGAAKSCQNGGWAPTRDYCGRFIRRSKS